MHDYIHLLIVEDDAQDALLVQRGLEAAKVNILVKHVGSLKAALQLLKEEHFDMVLLDLRLPDSSGWDTFQHLRASVLPHISVIILSGLNDRELSTRAVAAGATDFIVKGVDTRPITYAIQRWCFEATTASHAREQFALAAICQQVLTGTDLDVLFRETVALVAQTLGVEMCEILEFLPEGEDMLLRADVGWQDGHVQRTRLGSSCGWGAMLRNSEPIVSEDLRFEPRFSRALFPRYGNIIGALNVPIRGSGKAWGRLGAYTSKRRAFSRHQLNFLQAAAHILGQVIDRKLYEEQLAEQAALLDAAHDAILVIGMDKRILYWNKGAERTYGWSAAEALGRNHHELLYKDSTASQEARALLLANGEWRGELQKCTKDKRDITVEARWTLVRDARGIPKSIFAIDTDITEKKRLETQFLRAQRMESIGTLAGGIAHDLNNVLAPILMAVDLLQADERNSSRLKLISTIAVSANRGADLVKQVLSFARGVEGKRNSINLGYIARDIQKLIQETFPKRIACKVDIKRELWTVHGDPTQLNQVLMNLCVNARDAMPEGGKLVISLENIYFDELFSGMNAEAKQGPYVLVKVKDTGTGIPKEIKERVFDPFFTTKEVGKGTGLGLSTTLAIVRSHGGFINLSTELGKGTEFEVYLPATVDSATSQKPDVHKLDQPCGHGELILLVDDEETIRSVAQAALERFGYRVLLAGNGAEAVALYAQHRDDISVVLTDMAMPVMDGAATIIALKTINPDVIIVGSSGHDAGDAIAKALRAGVQHFVSKPYSAESLLCALREVLSPTQEKNANSRVE